MTLSKDDNNMKKPVVFISYSWSDDEYQDWIVNLAERLSHDGVHVKIDVWDLKEGQDKYVFMEQMVNSEEVEKVLLMCNEDYKIKADNREGGVGDETQIISSSIYNNVNQEKFIPVITERDDSGNEFTPNYIESRIYIDLSDNEAYEENYEKLLRNIYGRPQRQRPELGKPPKYLFQEQVSNLRSNRVLRKIESLKYNNIKLLESMSLEYFSELMLDLPRYEIVKADIDEIDDLVIDKIKEMEPVIKDFVAVIKILIQTKTLNIEYLIGFFEEIYRFSEFQKEGSYHKWQTEHYKFLIQQLFILTISQLLRYGKYRALSRMINSDYFVDTRYSNNHEPRSFTTFRMYLHSLDHRKTKLKLNRVSLQSDIMVEMAFENKSYFLQADLLLYFVYEFQKNDRLMNWFPMTYIHLKEPLKLIQRMRSREYFEQVKSMFGVDSKEEFIEISSKIEGDRGFSSSFKSIPRIQDFIRLDQIAIKP